MGGLSYVSLITTAEERGAVLAQYRLISLLGIVPAILLSVILSIPQFGVSVGEYDFNAYTYPALFDLLMQLTSLTFLAVALKSPEKKKEDKPSSKKFYVSKGTILLLVISFFQGYLIATFEYTLPVVMVETYGWSAFQYSFAVLAIGIVGVVAVLISRTLTKKLQSWEFLVIVPCLGYICLMSVVACIGALGSEWLPQWLGIALFLFGIETVYGAFQILQTIVSSVFSHIIPRDYLLQMMPMTAGLLALGKILGPMICELEVELLGIGLIFYVLLVVSAILLFVVIALSKHISPRAIQKVEQENEASLDSEPTPTKPQTQEKEDAPLLSKEDL